MRQNLLNIPIQKQDQNTLSVKGIIDYKNVLLLRKFITSEGKIVPRRMTGLSAKRQRYMTKAIKNARLVGFLPFVNKDY
jgi:small subunit ribosomal protein S18